MQYKLIRSDRKTVSLQVKGGELLVRAPRRLSKAAIEGFVRKHMDWIRKQMQKQSRTAAPQASGTQLTEKEHEELKKRAKQVFAERVAHFAPIVGVTYGRITIRTQKTRWGSCSSKGNLNFNCLLLLAPPEVLDCIVVHELCHRKQMNHSRAFYAEVLRVMPDYHTRHAWLKKNGTALMGRVNR
jgi:predicted metal-dependent hydrolase